MLNFFFFYSLRTRGTLQYQRGAGSWLATNLFNLVPGPKLHKTFILLTCHRRIQKRAQLLPLHYFVPSHPHYNTVPYTFRTLLLLLLLHLLRLLLFSKSLSIPPFLVASSPFCSLCSPLALTSSAPLSGLLPSCRSFKRKGPVSTIGSRSITILFNSSASFPPFNPSRSSKYIRRKSALIIAFFNSSASSQCAAAATVDLDFTPRKHHTSLHEGQCQ